jgi:hypothetical protein
LNLLIVSDFRGSGGSISGISCKNSPLVVGCCETRGEFLPKIPRSQIPNFFSPAAGLQKLIFDVFTFCSPPQAENFAVNLQKHDFTLENRCFTAKPKFSPSGGASQTDPKMLRNKGGIFIKGGVLQEIPLMVGLCFLGSL